MDRIIRRTSKHEHRAFVSIVQEQVDHSAAHAAASAVVELAETILAPAIIAFTGAEQRQPPDVLVNLASPLPSG
jgi:hypothetical protein